MKDCQTADPSSTPESRVRLGLGKKNPLFKVREALWLYLGFNKHVVCEVIVTFFSVKPDYNLSLTLSISVVSA